MSVTDTKKIPKTEIKITEDLKARADTSFQVLQRFYFLKKLLETFSSVKIS